MAYKRNPDTVRGFAPLPQAAFIARQHRRHVCQSVVHTMLDDSPVRRIEFLEIALLSYGRNLKRIDKCQLRPGESHLSLAFHFFQGNCHS